LVLLECSLVKGTGVVPVGERGSMTDETPSVRRRSETHTRVCAWVELGQAGLRERGGPRKVGEHVLGRGLVGPSEERRKGSRPVTKFLFFFFLKC
jgi:hypothetical protein